MSALDDDDNKEDVGFVLHFTTTDDHEDDKSLDEIPEDEEEHETGEVISQKSLHLLSMTHQTFVNVVQFDQEDTKEKDDQEKRGKTLVFRKQRSQSRGRLQPEINEIENISRETSYTQNQVSSILHKVDKPSKKTHLQKAVKVISDCELCPLFLVLVVIGVVLVIRKYKHHT